MQTPLIFALSSLLASFVTIGQFVSQYWSVLVVLAVHPVVMVNWALWFLRTLRELKG